MTERLRQSVPTPDVQRWWDSGWAYVMPDFDKPNHSIVEWFSDKFPVYPTAFNPTDNRANAENERDDRRQQPA